jgi:hypothetical protein
MSPVGLARFCTLRSWLSQWSYTIWYPGKEIYEIPGANHYAGLCTDWLQRHGLAQSL